MSAERSTESLIDVLYGELPEEEARELRAELGSEVEELDEVLGRIREAMPREEVSPAVHAAIMEAARVAASSAEHNGERALRRTPAEAQGFWRRVGRTQGSQLALVAAVLIAGMFVVRAVDRSDNPMLVAPSSIGEMQEAPPAAAMKPAPAQESAGAADEVAGDSLADQWTPGSEAPAEEAVAVAEPTADRGRAPEAPPADDAVAAESLRQELQATGEAKSAGRVAVADKVAPAPKRKAAAPTATRSTAARPMAKQEAKDSVASMDKGLDTDVLNAFGGDARANEGALTLKEAEEADAPAPQAAAEPQAAPAEYRPPANSIDAVNQYFRAGDYGGAIRAADEFLADNTGASATERATAMHVKAQSLEKQGKYTEADRIYIAIQKNYPAYNPGQINNAREEIRRKNAPRPSKKARSKADSEKSYDFEDAPVSY